MRSLRSAAKKRHITKTNSTTSGNAIDVVVNREKFRSDDGVRVATVNHGNGGGNEAINKGVGNEGINKKKAPSKKPSNKKSPSVRTVFIDGVNITDRPFGTVETGKGRDNGGNDGNGDDGKRNAKGDGHAGWVCLRFFIKSLEKMQKDDPP